ncbi:dipeptidase [Daejeonella lutea]|uniref:Membrane dipeptidase n=1 Tax=Daejeonella lutea TaxID=572036 RepID=A0A1T5AUD9_9SPHI|nr:dipeptidase [Daejeonella lutea]SKB38390.1 membrane dipeptidase [Daejeonella lutea]
MKKVLLVLSLISSIQVFGQSAKLHDKAIVVDTHGDIISDQIRSGIDVGKRQPGGNFDLVRAKEGGLDVQVFSIWCDATGGFAMANRQIDSLNALANRHPDKIRLVRTASELKSTVKSGRMAGMIGVEGGHMIESRLENLEALAARGMTYMTLTWNNSTPWASSAYDETFRKDSLKHIGLTDLGKQIITRMNELGVIVDLSHVGETTFYDAIRISTKPVMASHSSAYVFNAHQRNLKDDQIKAIAKTGGVVFVNFYSGFLDSTYSRKQQKFNADHRAELAELTKASNRSKAQNEINTKYSQEIYDMRAPLDLLIAHIDHMVKLVGSEHVGLGADFDGAESYPQHLDDVSDYPAITEALVKKGYSVKDIKNILGDNFVRLLRANKGK